MVTESLFVSFQNSFSASYFSISQDPSDQNGSLAPLWHYGIIIESSKCSENKNGQNFRNQNTGGRRVTRGGGVVGGGIIPNYCNAANTLKQV